MKAKIVILPLDERPCNMLFPKRLFSHGDFQIVEPQKLGEKKNPGDFKEISRFLKKECKDAWGLILSMDMLLYGGLVPSRVHHEGKAAILQRMEVIKELRRENEQLLIYGFQVIMRCPDYSISDEEPDYYAICGKQIHDAGVAIHKSRLGLDDDEQLGRLLQKIDPSYLNDYISRRETNRYMNVEALQYVRDGMIDALVIPQDDSSQYGYAALDQESIREKIGEYNVTDKVLMYPGADEVGLTLLSRMANFIHGMKPKVYVKYASEVSREMIPLYEGCTLSSSIKYHVLSAGCQMTESYELADIILAVTAPSNHMEEALNQPSRRPEYYAERNMAELVDFIQERMKDKKIISIADNAYANGGDMDLIRLLNKNRLLMEVNGYAGWNTSANTLGTAIAQAVDALYFGNGKMHKDFLLARYMEDGGYCSVVRQQITEMLPGLGMDLFDIKAADGEVSRLVKKGLEKFARDELNSLAPYIHIKKVSLPWRRMFEVNLEVEFCQE